MDLKAGHRALLFVLAASFNPAGAVQPEESDFTWMTLNGITCAVVVVEGITPDLENYGVKSQQVGAHLDQRLTELGIKAVPLENARTTPGAAQIKLRLVANRDAHGF